MKKLWILLILIFVSCTAKPIYYELPTAPGFRAHEKNHLSTLADGDVVLIEDASDGCATKHTLMSDIAAYLYADNVISDIQAQFDARCLESVFGTSIGTGILLDGTALKASTILQKYHGVDPSAITLLFLADGNATAVRATIGAYGSGDAPVFATVNTGQGAYEVFKQDQDTDTGADVEFNSVNATAFNGVATANPQTTAKDSNCTDDDINFLIDVNATETGSGAEDIQVKHRAQRNGTMTTYSDFDPENDEYKIGSEAVLVRAVGGLVGEVPISLDTAATVTLVANDANGQARFNNDADVIQYDLPSVEAGLVILLYDIAGGVISVNPYDGTDTIYLNGTSVGAGDEIDSPGNVGDFICLMGIDATRWVTIGRSGSWIDGGAS